MQANLASLLLELATMMTPWQGGGRSSVFLSFPSGSLWESNPKGSRRPAATNTVSAMGDNPGRTVLEMAAHQENRPSRDCLTIGERPRSAETAPRADEDVDKPPARSLTTRASPIGTLLLDPILPTPEK